MESRNVFGKILAHKLHLNVKYNGLEEQKTFEKDLKASFDSRPEVVFIEFHASPTPEAALAIRKAFKEDTAFETSLLVIQLMEEVTSDSVHVLQVLKSLVRSAKIALLCEIPLTLEVFHLALHLNKEHLVYLKVTSIEEQVRGVFDLLDGGSCKILSTQDEGWANHLLKMPSNFQLLLVRNAQWDEKMVLMKAKESILRGTLAGGLYWVNPSTEKRLDAKAHPSLAADFQRQAREQVRAKYKKGDKGPFFTSKLVIVGEGNVGKTSLSRTLRGKDMEPYQEATRGMEVQKVLITVDTKHSEAIGDLRPQETLCNAALGLLYASGPVDFDHKAVPPRSEREVSTREMSKRERPKPKRTTNNMEISEAKLEDMDMTAPEPGKE